MLTNIPRSFFFKWCNDGENMKTVTVSATSKLKEINSGFHSNSQMEILRLKDSARDFRLGTRMVIRLDFRLDFQMPKEKAMGFHSAIRMPTLRATLRVTH